MKKFLFLFAIAVLPLFAQSNTGELHLSVKDPAGLGVKSSVELVCEANQFQQNFVTDNAGNLTAKRLPFGLYRIHIQHAGFADLDETLEIRSALPKEFFTKLTLAGSQDSVFVNDSDTLIDPYNAEIGRAHV